MVIQIGPISFSERAINSVLKILYVSASKNVIHTMHMDLSIQSFCSLNTTPFTKAVKSYLLEIGVLD